MSMPIVEALQYAPLWHSNFFKSYFAPLDSPFTIVSAVWIFQPRIHQYFIKLFTCQCVTCWIPLGIIIICKGVDSLLLSKAFFFEPIFIQVLIYWIVNNIWRWLFLVLTIQPGYESGTNSRIRSLVYSQFSSAFL